MSLPHVWIFKVYHVGIGGWNRYTENIIKYVGDKLPLGIISEKCNTGNYNSKVMCLEPHIKFYNIRNKCAIISTYLQLKLRTYAMKIPIIHFPSQESFIYDLMASAKKYIMTIHGLSFLYGPTDKKYARKMLILKKRINKLSKIITVSHWAKNNIMDFFKIPEEKIEVIYNCVDRKVFNENKTKYDNHILKMLGITKPYFIHVSSGDKIKNIEFILKAMKYSRRKDYLLVLVGLSLTNRKRIIRYASYHGLIHRLKIIPPIRNDYILAVLYRGAHALIMPSYHESCPFTLIEAMSTGTLCIVSKRAALPEIAGDAAIYINIRNPIELSVLMDEICSGRYSSLNSNGIKRVIKLFNPRLFALKHIKIYKELLEELQGR